MAGKKKSQVKITAGFSSHTSDQIREQVRKKFSDGTLTHLVASRVEERHLPAIQADLALSLKMVGTAVTRVMDRGFDENATDPAVAVGTPDSIMQVKPSQFTRRQWAPLSYRSVMRKLARPKDFHMKVWAHRRKYKNRIVTALHPALSELEALGRSARFDRLYTARKAPVVNIGGSTRMKFEYVLRIPHTGSPDADLIAKLVLHNFFRGTWRPLDKTTPPPGRFSGGRNSPPDAGSVLYVEALRPLIGPMSAAAGKAFRQRLRRLLK